jgi:hypothetical protein
MSATQAIIVVGVFVVILTVMVVVMTRLNRIASQRIQRRREAWKAAGETGACPGDGPFPGDFSAPLYNIGAFGG